MRRIIFNKEYLYNNIEIIPESGCWIWMGTCKGEYGRIEMRHKSYYVHRLSFELYKHPLNDLDCCHHCDTPPCVNPYHLFAGTQTDNNADMIKKNRGVQLHGEVHWKRKLDEELVREIQSKYIPRVYSTIKLAEEYGMSQGQIYEIVKKRAWKHLW